MSSVESKTPITSIAELRKAIEYAFVRGEFARENVMFALKRFEGSVRERLKELEHKTIVVPGEDDITNFEQTILELRRVLGEGDERR